MNLLLRSLMRIFATMKLVKANIEQVGRIMEIVEQARLLLRQSGSPQWQNGYPQAADIEEDCRRQIAHIMLDGDEIIAYGAVIFTGEAAYNALEGKWLSDRPYVVLHRLAVAQARRGQGVATRFFEAVARMAAARGVESFRVDTHEMNRIMRHTLQKLGFTCCGTVWYDGSPRLAYERMLKP